MIIHQHESNNSVLAPPSGSTDVSALPVTVVACADGTIGVRSYWKPTDEEIELILQGKPVMLMIWGRTHAPVFLGVDGGPGTEWHQL